MNMTFALLARFNNPVVPLKEVCQEFFGITPKTAEQKAKAGTLPVPTFKMRDSERAPTLVNISDLGEFLELRYQQGREQWDRVNG